MIRVLVLALVALVASCATAPTCVLPPARPAGPPHLWRAEKPGAPGALVLFGTIHITGIADVSPTVLAALDASTRFASELGDTEVDPARLTELARLPRGQLLSQLLPADDWYELETVMRGVMKPADLQASKPWFALIRLMSHVAPSPKPSMDVALAERAKTRRIPIDHLETWDQQITALDAAIGVTDLSETIHERKEIACSQAKLRAAYLASDVAVLEATLRVTNNKLLAERNRAWLAQLEAYATTPGTTFVAVGLGHLLGPDSVIALLERDGFIVRGGATDRR